MPSLARALDPDEAQKQFDERLGHLAGDGGRLELRGIRVARYKPGRRCVVEYALGVERADGTTDEVVLLGKVRVRRFGKSGYRQLRAFREAGFGGDATDGIRVPEPVGTISKFRMWLQRKVPGRTATELLPEAGGEELARRIAEAAHKVHQSGVPTGRRHTMEDELRILHERLPEVAREEPRLEGRIRRLLEACDNLGAGVREPEPCGIHRDFYADQVIVDEAQLYLIDFDLYCEGDPALDVGNFLGHLTEQGLRTLGDQAALAGVGAALEERFVELAGEGTREAVRAYSDLTLVRHVHLSTLFEERRAFTGDLLGLCEERLGVGSR
ncbi:phosphotransferase [Rubrobacter tropicus]|uniref:Phosphotransferase n=2 Tax=Rubrobacter tropicus TaxID=2653851 RepID=A0A6G8QF15_9ACTN|nr:phosphotransferase [Rubrobacter tropicus]